MEQVEEKNVSQIRVGIGLLADRIDNCGTILTVEQIFRDHPKLKELGANHIFVKWLRGKLCGGLGTTQGILTRELSGFDRAANLTVFILNCYRMYGVGPYHTIEKAYFIGLLKDGETEALLDGPHEIPRDTDEYPTKVACQIGRNNVGIRVTGFQSSKEKEENYSLSL